MTEPKRLSDRLRPDVETAPWVIEAVVQLEVENQRLRAGLKGVLGMIPEGWPMPLGFGQIAAKAREGLGDSPKEES